VPGILSKIPARLGFWHELDTDISYLDTKKVCLKCFQKAAPNGFTTWTTYYKKPEVVNDRSQQARPDMQPLQIPKDSTMGTSFHPKYPSLNLWGRKPLKAGSFNMPSDTDFYPRQIEAGHERFELFTGGLSEKEINLTLPLL
jgi:hypothetical protein